MSHVRRIVKPVENTVIVAVNGIVDHRFVVNTVTGVAFLSEADEPPSPNDLITAGFEFDVPCRFDMDTLAVGLQSPSLGQFTLPLVELRLTVR